MKILETNRLTLHSWKEADADAYFRINQDSKVTEFLPRAITLEESRAFVAEQNLQQRQRGYCLWACELKDGGEFIGFVGLHYTDWKNVGQKNIAQENNFLSAKHDSLLVAAQGNGASIRSDLSVQDDSALTQKPNFAPIPSFIPAVEIGWRIGSQFWRKGYATEAARAALEFGFEKIGLSEIVSFTVPANLRSIGVMEKIGMKRDVAGDFLHPKLPLDHRLSQHVLYRIRRDYHF